MTTEALRHALGSPHVPEIGLSVLSYYQLLLALGQTTCAWAASEQQRTCFGRRGQTLLASVARATGLSPGEWVAPVLAWLHGLPYRYAQACRVQVTDARQNLCYMVSVLLALRYCSPFLRLVQHFGALDLAAGKTGTGAGAGADAGSGGERSAAPAMPVFDAVRRFYAQFPSAIADSGMDSGDLDAARSGAKKAVPLTGAVLLGACVPGGPRALEDLQVTRGSAWRVVPKVYPAASTDADAYALSESGERVGGAAADSWAERAADCAAA